MNRLPRFGVCLAMLVAGGGSGLSAQANITVTVQMPVSDVFALTISPVSTPLGTPTAQVSWGD